MKKAMVLLCLAVTLIASTQELYAGRYFVPEMARWATPDPALRDKLPKDLVQMQDGKLLSTSPYVYTYDNPLKYTDPDGKIPTVVGALSGAALDIGLQVATNYVQGRSLADISWKQVAISAGLGAAGAGLASKAGQLFRLASKADDVVNLADDATRGVTKLADEVSGLADDAGKVEGQIHHIATDKSIKSGFTEQFERIFSKAGMSLQDQANKVFLAGHKGRHAAAYHRYVLNRLGGATKGLSGDAYSST